MSNITFNFKNKNAVVTGGASGIGFQITLSFLEAGGNVSVCSGTNSTLLTLSGLTGTVVRWEYSYDNFLTSGVTISNTAP